MSKSGYTWRDGHPQRRAAYLAQLARDGYLVCWRFEVVDVDSYRVDQVMITPVAPRG